MPLTCCFFRRIRGGTGCSRADDAAKVVERFRAQKVQYTVAPGKSVSDLAILQHSRIHSGYIGVSQARSIYRRVKSRR
jgi:hypothetical protein